MAEKKESKKGIALTVSQKTQESAEKSSVEVLGIVEEARTMIIANDDDLAFASEILRDVKSKAAELEAEKKRATDPISASLAVIRGWFKPALDACSEVETTIKNKMLEYRKDAETRRAQLLAEASESSGEEGQAALDAIASVQGRASGVHISKVWRVEVLDKSQVPLEYLLVDEKALVKHAQKSEGSGVPGVRFYQEEQVSSMKS